MKPVTFSRRYVYSKIFPEGVVKVKDLATGQKFYAVWRKHPDNVHFTVLRKLFATHADSASYATRFRDRYTRLTTAKILLAMRENAKTTPWWKRLVVWVRLLVRRVAHA